MRMGAERCSCDTGTPEAGTLLMLITLAKLYSKTQMDKRFTAFFKIVLGEIASHCMLA